MCRTHSGCPNQPEDGSRPPVEHQQRYVGIDLHWRRSVIVRMSEEGQVLGVDQVVNDTVELSMAVAKAGPDPEVALEATYGLYWAVDLLEADGAKVHLVHPLGLHWDSRRVKNDVRDSTNEFRLVSPGERSCTRLVASRP